MTKAEPPSIPPYQGGGTKAEPPLSGGDSTHNLTNGTLWILIKKEVQDFTLKVRGI